jgi:hypothetical protein
MDGSLDLAALRIRSALSPFLPAPDNARRHGKRRFPGFSRSRAPRVDGAIGWVNVSVI